MTFGGGTVKALNFTSAWGLSPGSGTATVLGSFSISTGQDFAFTLGGATVYGVVKNPVLNLDAGSGESYSVPLVDNREKLQWDHVECYFNVTEIIEVDPATYGLARKRRYRSILPNDWHAQIVTYTDNPLTAAQILTAIFGADTVRYSWTYVTHTKLSDPVYNIEADTGSTVGNLVQQVLDKLCLLMRLSGQYQLTFGVKGDASLPTYTGTNVKNINLGEAMSNQAPAVRIVGDRNRYQVLHLDLVADWKSAWEAYLFEGDWLDAVKTSYSLPDTTPSERAMISAKARTISVNDWVTKTSDSSFVDTARFGDVSRMSMPAWVYINDIVFKAYRMQTDGSDYPQPDGLNGIPLHSLKLEDGLLARATYNATTGALSYYAEGGVYQIYTDDKAFIISRGQPVDLSDPAKRDVLDPDSAGGLASKWFVQNRFKIDHKNFTVVFDDPVFEPGEGDDGLFLFVNSDTDLPADHPSRHLVVPNAAATISAAAVRGSFCFSAERYHRDFGSGVRRAASYVSGLSFHCLMEEGAFKAEIKYDTSPVETADQKAQKAANAFLAKTNTYSSGSFERLGTAGTTLTPALDRVTYTLDASGGLREVVEFTKERGPDYFESERELERRALSDDLFPGMRDNRETARDYEYQSKVLAGLRATASTRKYLSLNDIWNTPVGNVHSAPTTVFPSEAYAAGEVIFLNVAGTADVNGKVFQGVVISANLQDGKAHPVATQGTVPVKITGKCVAGAQVGVNDGEKVARVGGTKIIGRVTQSYDGTGTVTLPVRLGGEAVDALGPFDLISLSADGKLRLAPGVVNQLIPDDPFDEIDCSGHALTYVKLKCETDANQVSTASYEADGTKAAPPAAVKGAPPPSFKAVIGLVVKTTVGSVDSYSYYRVWPKGYNVVATPSVWITTDRDPAPTAGQTLLETWYSWNLVAG